MPAIATILDDLAQSVRDDAPEVAFGKVATAMQVIAKALPLAWAISRGQQYGIYQGIMFGQDGSQFFARVQLEDEQKQVLAEYCLEKCGLRELVASLKQPDERSSTRLFFESGSTIAHTIGKFAIELSNQRDLLISEHKREAAKSKSSAVRSVFSPSLPLAVVTNNLIGITALAGLVREVEPIQGRLDLKYYGFLPFHDATPHDRMGVAIELTRYKALCEDVRTCSDVFATCSTFSFLFGPLVGSRANCITKAAMYGGAQTWSASEGKQFYLCLHFEKIVPFLDNHRIGFDQPTSDCCCVCPLPVDALASAVTKWGEANAEDTLLKNAWHEGIIGSTTSVTIPATELCGQWIQHRLAVPTVSASWLDWLAKVPGVNVLISLPIDVKDKAVAIGFLQREITCVNKVLTAGDFGYQFVVVNATTMTADGVAHVQYREATP